MPMDRFFVPVKSIAEGVKVMDVLAQYDMFQLENNIKPDYCNAGGIEIFEDENGWMNWYDEETGEDDPSAWLEAQTKGGIDGR